MNILLVCGVAADRARLVECLRAGDDAAASQLSVVDTLQAALQALRTREPAAIVVGTAAPCEEWRATVRELRAAAPRSALIVVADAALPADVLEPSIQDLLLRRHLSPSSLQRSLRYSIARQASVDARDEARIALAAKARLRRVIDAVADVLLIVDPRDGQCSDANLAFERIFRLPMQSVLESGLACLESSRRIHSTAELLGFIRQQLETGSHEPAQWVFRRGADQEVWCTVQVSATERAGSHEALLSIHDASAGILAEQANKRAYAESARAARTRHQFLANMSHEMRTPLNAILNFSQIALGQVPPAPFDAHLAQIQTASRLMLALVNDVLDLAQIESGRYALAQSAFDLHKVVDDLGATVRPAAHDAGLELVLEADPALPRHWVGDRLRIQQVLLNLLGNAVKFTHQGRIAVVLGAWCDEAGTPQGIDIGITDTGIGMTAEQLKRLFRPFEQAGARASRRSGGTGLGLAITRHLVELMGGHIDVQSSLAGGSRFGVRLPLMPLPLPPGLAAPQPVTLRYIGVDDATTVECLLALGRSGMVAEVLGAWVPAEADAVLIATGRVRSQPGGLAAALAKVATPRALVALLGATEAEAAAARHAGLQVVGLPDQPGERFELLAQRLLQQLATPHRAADQALAGLRVLLVEDNPVNQLIARQLLAARGCVVTLAGDGEQAIERVAAGAADFDLILMDVQMPGIDGNEAARRLRRGGVALPIIALSAHAFEEDRQAALAAGMDAYVTKPLDIEALADAMQRVRSRPALVPNPVPTPVPATP